MARSKKAPEVKIENYVDARLVLVSALNDMLAGKITPSQNKSIAYSIQCILSCLNKQFEGDNASEDSIKELVAIINAEREKAKAN